MLKKITERQHRKCVEHEVQFLYDGNSGFGFPCDERGNLLPMGPEAQANYDYCMAHPEEFETWNDQVARIYYVTDNATGTCVCGATVELWDQYLGACKCPGCDRWYNLFGQELLPPEYWEDEEA